MKLHFFITGDATTRLIRMFWEEGSCIRAFKTTDSLNIPLEMALDLMHGKVKLTGSTKNNGFLINETDDYNGIDITTMTQRFEKNIMIQRRNKLKFLVNMRNLVITALTDGKYNRSEQNDIELFTKVLLQDERKENNYLSELSFLYTLQSKSLQDFYEKLNQTITTIEEFYEEKDNEKRMRINELYKDVQPKPKKPKKPKYDIINAFMERQQLLEEMDGSLGSYKDSSSGYLLPDGSFYPCPKMGHIELVNILKEKGVFVNDCKKSDYDPDISDDHYVEKIGWIKISQLKIFYFRGFTRAQFDFVSKMILHYNMQTISIACQTMKIKDFFEKYDIL